MRVNYLYTLKEEEYVIIFEKLKIKNFMSFGEQPTTFPLNEKGTTLILGHNVDASGDSVSRNGSGKSASIQAILFALYGKGLDKLKADEYVNITNGKKLEVTLEFEKDDVKYKVVRKRKPSSLDLYINEETHTLDSMANTDALIQDIIGMSHEVFLTSFFLTPHNDAFMAMSGVDQRSIIESLLSLDTLVKRAESLKLIKKDLEVDFKLIERDIAHYVDHNEKVEQNIARLAEKSDAWASEKQASIISLQNDLDQLSKVDFDEVESELARKEEIEDSITSKNLLVSDMASELHTSESKATEYRHQWKAIHDKKKLLEEALGSVDSWEEDNLREIEALEQSLKSTDNHRKMIDAFKEIDTVDGKLAECKKMIDTSAKKVSSMLDEVETKTTKLESLEAGTCYACHQSHTDPVAIKSLTAEIEALMTEIEIVSVTLDDVEKEQTRLQELKTSLDVDLDGFTLRGLESDLVSNENTFKMIDRQRGITNPHVSRLETYNDEGVTLEGLEADLAHTKDLGASVVKIVEGLQLDIENLKKEVTTLKNMTFPAIEELGISSKADIKVLQMEIDTIQTKLAEVTKMVDPYTEQLDVTKDSAYDVSEKQVELDELAADIKHCQYLVKMLTDNKSFVRKNIVDRYIPMVNKKIVEYTEILGLLHIPSINNDLSTDIEYLNKKVSYFNLSQGERLRTNLAVSLAFRHLMTTLGNDTNMLIIDEFFDSGGDAMFLQKAFFLTQGIADTVIMVSHRDEYKEIVNKTITIVKENGFSSVEGSV